MAFSDPRLYLAEFRVPADNYEFLHLMQINGALNPRHAVSEFFKHANVDAKLERMTAIQSPAETADRLAKLKTDAKGNHRDLVGDEAKLTKAEVDALGAGLQALNIPGLSIPPGL